MVIIVLAIVALAALVAAGQWYVTRPTDRRAIDLDAARSHDDSTHGRGPSTGTNTFTGF